MENKRVGVMGGTFNPIHKGHLSVAESALKQFNLDEILFITGGNPPHKKDLDILPAFARHKMVCLATEDYEKFIPCDYEVLKKTYSYSLETMKYLKKQYKNTDFFFIIGADSFHDLPTWYRPRALLELCTLLVYDRDGYDMKKDYEVIKKEYYCHVDFIQSEKINVSSSFIREEIKNGKDVSDYLPEKVYDYIKRNSLYQSRDKDLKKEIKKILNKERYIHSLGVSRTAAEMAKIYGANPKKAYVAGLMHDCAKNLSKSKALQKCSDYGVELDAFEHSNRALIHAKLGEKVAAAEYGITDENILQSIKWHTLGRPGMSTLEKIIYVADMIEPSREFEGVDILRDTAFKDLDKAVIDCTKTTIAYNENKGKPVHPNAYALVKDLEQKTNDNMK